MSKNTRNRILLTAIAALLLVTLTIGGTVAWLTASTTEVTNTFTSTNISIDIWEHPINDDGKTVDAEGKPVKENTGYLLYPGATLEKDPYVEVTTGPCYIFVEVENTAADYISYKEAATWVKINEVNSGTSLYAYVGDGNTMKSVPTGEKVYFLDNDQIKVLTSVNVNNLSQYDPEVHYLKFKAYAIQADHLDATDYTPDQIFEMYMNDRLQPTP